MMSLIPLQNASARSLARHEVIACALRPLAASRPRALSSSLLAAVRQSGFAKHHTFSSRHFKTIATQNHNPDPVRGRLSRSVINKMLCRPGNRSAFASRMQSSALDAYLFHRARRRLIPDARSFSTRKDPSRNPQPPTSDLKGRVISNWEKTILSRLPNIPERLHGIHRPSREELLAAATGFWSRLRVRFKWFSIRDIRPFNLDDISAFFSWLLVGHLLWIIIGTTTFFSLVIFAANTVFAQESLAGWIGNYFTKSSGIKVVFESAIVPKWGDGVISFKNVFVSRRPGSETGLVKKGSPTSAAAAVPAGPEDQTEKNFTQFDLSIESVDVTLSFTKWFNGKGLLRDVSVKGVRGVVDRTQVEYGSEYIDPRNFKHEHSHGDFEIESFKIDDLLVSIYQPDNFRPYSVSIFSADLPQLRKQWLFYDFLSANHVSGSFDDSLFTLHPRQTHSITAANLTEGSATGERGIWKKQSRLRIDGLNIDHLNSGVEGPFGWINEGNVDIVADIMLPTDNDESIAKLMADLYDRMEATVTFNRIPNEEHHIIEDTPPSMRELDANELASPEDKRFLVLDLRLNLNDVHASVPLFTQDIGYVNNALIRPIVAYINSKKQFIPINCRVVKRASEFDGSWTVYDSGLMEDLSKEAYEAFAKDVVDDQARRRRIKKVGLWSLQLAVQALFLGLAGNVA